METQSASMVERFLLPHANPMTLGGTNAYVLGAPDIEHITVVDPGTDDQSLLDQMVRGRRIALILLTHHHGDHSMGAGYLHSLSGAPVRAWRPDLCVGEDPLKHDEDLDASGLHLRVLHTPGHTSDSVCFHAPSESPHGKVLTGDTILGRGTTIIEHPDGLLSDYLRSLDILESLGRAQVLPGHGPSRQGIAETVAEYRTRRLGRLSQLETTLVDHNHSSVAELAAHIYPTKTHPRTRRAAERTIAAQLRYLGDPRGFDTATPAETPRT